MSKISISADTLPPLTPNLKSAINNALLTHNAIPKIQAALLHSCQATGFTATLRARTLELLRSGECNNYSEVVDRVLSELIIGDEDGVVVNGKGAVNQGGLIVPGEVISQGIDIVRGAVEGVVTVGEKGD